MCNEMCRIDVLEKKDMNRTSESLYDRLGGFKFSHLTLFLGILDLETGELIFTNGVHNPPYLVRKGGVPERLAQRNGPAIALRTRCARWPMRSPPSKTVHPNLTTPLSWRSNSTGRQPSRMLKNASHPARVERGPLASRGAMD